MAEYQTARAGAGVQTAQLDEGLRTHMNKVYGTMSVGLLVTALAAWAIGSSPTLLSIFRDPVTLSPNILGWVIMFAPLIMVFAFGAAINRLSAASAQLFFYAFAAVMGISMSSIFLIYTPYSIVQTLLVTAIAFAGLSLYGYTTKRDLSGMGTFLMMGVIGLIGAMIVNLFLQSGVMMMAISAIGVLIFAGLTAYYTQAIKSEYVAHAAHGDQEWLDKAAIDGALSLYIAFLNLFQFLLMFMGSQE